MAGAASAALDRQAPALSAEQWARIDDLVLAEQARTLYRGIAPTALSVSMGVPILTGLFWSQVPHSHLLLWAAASWIVFAPLSLLLLMAFRARQQLPSDSRRWLAWQQGRYLLGCLAFGSAGFALFTPDTVAHQWGLFAFLFALASTLMAEAAQYPPLYRVAFPALLGPIIVRSLMEPTTMNRWMGLLIAAGMVYTALTTRNLSRTVRDSLVFRFASELLTEELRAQKSRADEALDQARAANLAKSRFLAAASHDLRQPVHAMGLFASALEPHVVSQQGKHVLARVQATVATTEQLFSAMLDVSRLDAQVQAVDLASVPVLTLLRRLTDEYTPSAQAKELTFRLRLPRDGAFATSDATLLERVLRNYLSNSVRYTERGGLLLACRKRGPCWRLAVWDTGVGIDDAHHAEIYQEFFQLGNSERDRSLGLGLGLAIVERVSRLLDHPVGMLSRPGKGSVFWIDVPAAPGSPLVEHSATPSKKFDPHRLVGTCVLVIDDEAEALEASALLLGHWGCLVVAADSAEQALVQLRELDIAPQVILSDYRLRGRATGSEAIQSLRARFGPVPAALVTGDTAPDRLREAALSGHEVLFKPLNPVHLKQALCAMLESSTHRDDQ